MSRSTNIFLFMSVAIACMAMTMTQGASTQGDGRSVARAYLAGMESHDWVTLDSLFLDKDRSTILENASDEGSWENYRDHHLKPEMESSQDFKFTVIKESEERFGDAVLVRHVGTFTMVVNDETRAYRAAVSYVLVMEDDRLQIAHVHWSSRPDRRAEQPH